MRLAFDASIQSPRGRATPTGVERAQATLIAALAEAPGDHELLLLGNHPLPEALTSRPRVTTAGASSLPVALWRETRVPALLREHDAALLHEPVVATPVAPGRPVIVTVHELPWAAERRAPGARDGHSATLRHRLATHLAASRATRLVCVSERTRRDLVGLHPDCAPRTLVVPHAVDARFTPADAATPPRAALLRGLGLDDGRLLLAVGRQRAKKNLGGLVEAVARLSRTGRADDLRLVLVGPEGETRQALSRRVAQPDLAGRAVLAGYVEDGLLVDLYRRAEVVVVPSVHEGFGLPAVEAMACGAPVLAAAGGLADEAAGDAVATFAVDASPDAPGGLAGALATLLDDPAARASRVAAGKVHAASLSPERLAARMLALYAEVAAAHV